MKHYKLAAWPDLPAAFQRTAYQRMLHRMSQHHASVAQLMHESGLRRGAVIQFLDSLAEQQLLDEQETVSPSRLAAWRPLAWLRRRKPSDPA